MRTCREIGSAREESVAHDDDAGRAVGDLTAIGAAHPSFDRRVGGVVIGEAGLGERPVTCLRVRVLARVRDVQRSNGVDVRVVQSVAAVVLLGEAVEHVRPHVAGLGALATDVGRGTEVLGGKIAGHIAFDLGADHERDVVTPRFELGGCRQQRHRPRRARGLVAHRRGAPQPRRNGRGHRTQVSLPGEQLTERVAHVHDVDLAGVDTRGVERRLHGVGEQVGEVAALTGEIAREVRLVPAEHRHCHDSLVRVRSDPRQ